MRRINDDKIEKYVNELGEEYKDLLFEALLKKSDSLSELSVSELLRIDNDVKKYLQRQEVNKRNRKFLVLGATYVFLGIFMYLFSDIMLKFYDLRYLSPIELIQIMSTIVSCVGVMSCFYPFLIDYKRNRKYKDTSNESKKLIEYEVISKWRELEGIGNDIALKNDVVTNKSVIQLLSYEDLISEDEKVLLTNFLKLRNMIVHNSKLEMSQQDMLNEINRINELIEKINCRLQPNGK